MLILYHARKEESGLPYPQKDTLMFNLPMGITHIILLYKKLRLFFQTAVVFFYKHSYMSTPDINGRSDIS